MVGLVSFACSVVVWTLAIWLTVRVCDGTNEFNSLKAAGGWATLQNALLMVPLLMVPVGIPTEWLAPLTAVACFASLLVVAGVFWRYYQFGSTKSLVAVPVLMVSLIVVTLCLGALVIGAAVGLQVAGLVELPEQQLRDAMTELGAPAIPGAEQAEPGQPTGLPPATDRQPSADGQPPDLSEGIKPVAGMPGHYSYKDKQGKTHIVDSFDKVPEEYRR
jgi:hypothetical protein